ncbi:hypothetical protein, partial [Vibrio alginolyticus]|uniref:hypothetical protein n=1 Tax=Vibrio alginolyticus TaxID=663 RepID=UPI001A907FB5
MSYKHLCNNTSHWFNVLYTPHLNEKHNETFNNHIKQHENFATFQSDDQPCKCTYFCTAIPTLGPLHGQ